MYSHRSGVTQLGCLSLVDVKLLHDWLDFGGYLTSTGTSADNCNDIPRFRLVKLATSVATTFVVLNPSTTLSDMIVIVPPREILVRTEKLTMFVQIIFSSSS